MTGAPAAVTRLGICSVTFRGLDPDQVIAAVAGHAVARTEKPAAQTIAIRPVRVMA